MTTPETVIEVVPSRAVELLRRDGEAARDFARESLSPATRRAYQTDVDAFMTWCQGRGVQGLPAEPETVAGFLAHEAERGLRASTVARRASGIRLLHRAAGFETPTTSEIVRTTLKGIRRSLGVAPQQKAPATVEVILDMMQHVPDNLRGTRDRALLLFAFASACRRSELSALFVSDLTEVPEGFRVTIRKSKGDQEGEGQEIAVVRGRKACPVAALKNWLEAASITDGPVFRRMRRGDVVLDDSLRPQGIAQVVKLYAEKAGYDPADFSGHSLRSGFLTSAAARGASIFKLIEVSRHKSVDTLRGYIRKVEIFENHAGEGLL
jgi:site-specific recombinase XerD